VRLDRLRMQKVPSARTCGHPLLGRWGTTRRKRLICRLEGAAMLWPRVAEESSLEAAWDGAITRVALAKGLLDFGMASSSVSRGGPR
jgi:hypothetical protein